MTVFGIDVVFFCMIAWAVIGTFVFGAWYEVNKPISDDEFAYAFAISTFWPLALVVACVAGVGWCLSWVPRGPIRLVKYLRRSRTDLPEARIV